MGELLIWTVRFWRAILNCERGTSPAGRAPRHGKYDVKVISHRGYWKNPDEKNAEIAFARSFRGGFGTETDLRDRDGVLVVAHDPAGASAITAEQMFRLHQEHDSRLTLALNIKADGLQNMLTALLPRFEPTDFFVFDMSIPDTLGWIEHGVPFFTRHSDLEPTPALYEQAAGVWLDAFQSDWWDIDVIRGHVDAGKRVCIVSPDLHRRDGRRVWERLAKSDFVRSSDEVILCTDFPEEAKEILE